ncbi:MAG TPA: L-threonylcarbamoyladenylate synthase [Steroidobacteraceae bacterium]|nr:L-threonylcarbamoyladenylate synthase [Steroidobacteraceae bacterium]
MLPDPARIEEAAGLLRRGQLVAFPTETVYGLGADAGNAAAVARVFAAKGRPPGHPLIVHVSGLESAREWTGGMPEAAERLAEAFWPGPLTLVLPKAAQVLPAVTGGQDTVALRAPAHPVARALLAAFGGGIAAPSANRYGRISPTRAADVREELGDAVALVLDGGDCEVGLESTIVACLGGRVTLLRPGAVSRSQIADVVGTISDPDASAPRAPGRMRSHYAPRTPLALLEAPALAAEAARALAAGERIAVMARSPAPPDWPQPGWRRMPEQPAAYGRVLYATLRALDASGAERILVEAVPATEGWAAVADRLARAAAAGSGPAAEGDVPEAP